ncbi:uncharacterized protein LOC129773024 [Toxorhynchites rutilus septentrionalis]|uniref:uncharacterized protein LOC129773024 n=1 Tax=Toxorhynchites rutilus septentrionalis TaxID=329112 RepID=UPI002479977C|nr:uncharacterized protein LOC129773024 [Toxorhynchites rutilus septentrionalis]
MASASKSLRRQEQFCLDTMENVLHFMHNYDEVRDKFQIEGWKTRLNEVFSNFQTIRLKLELIDEEEESEEREDEYRRVRDSFEKNYVKVIGFLAAADRKANPPVPPAVASSSVNLNPNPTLSRIKLPEVKLPTFDGTFAEWLSFRDSFKSLIDSNPNLCEVDKLSYLLGSLTKDAKRIVESIEITSANYSVAWELLQNRFDNKKSF